MKHTFDRRQFLRVAGTSLGAGVLLSIAPGMTARPAAGLRRWFHHQNGEALQPFRIVQLSDAHVGFSGAPNPTGTRAFAHAIDVVNALDPQPELVLFTGDLTHEADSADEHAERMQRFKSITAQLRVKKVYHVPGEHDAALDDGTLYRQHFGETHYSFDHRGVHFVALDNVSSGKPAIGVEQLAWLKRDLARYPHSAPLIVFTHRPLFDLRPDWEWFTRDGADVLNVLAPYENVTVLYGHIHRHDVHQTEHATHYASRSLIFGFPDPASSGDKKPVAFDPEQPFRNLGIQQIADAGGRATVNDVELTMHEYAGTDGVQQILKSGAL